MKFLEYLFTPIPGSSFRYYIPFLIAAAVLFVGGIIFKKLTGGNKAIRRTFKKIPGYLEWCGILLALLLAFRYERIPYFSMRFLLFIVLMVVLVLTGKGIYLYFKKYPEEAERLKKPEIVRKMYLPHKKKRY